MRINKLLGAVTAATVALAPVAATAAPTIGSLVAVKGDAYVAREGRLLRAQPAMAVNAGDRVITRNGAVANVALGNCSVDVAGGEMKTFASDSCSSVQSASFSRAAGQSQHGSQLLGGGSGFIIAILAVGAIALGIVAATSGSSRPTSP
jgi:hypothetical protein